MSIEWKLWHSIMLNDISEIRQILSNNLIDINYNDDQALRFACLFCNYDIVKILIDNGAKVNNSCMYLTCSRFIDGPKENEKDSIKIVNLLIDNGSNVNDKNIICTTASSGCKKLLKVLLKQKIDNMYVSKALEVASSKGHIKIVKLLVNKLDFISSTSIQWALNNNNLEIYEILLHKFISQMILKKYCKLYLYTYLNDNVIDIIMNFL